MSAVVGERDRVLLATVPRNLNPTAGKSLDLTFDPPAFHQNSAGIPTFPAITFTAVLNGFVGTVMWSITSGGKLTGTTPNVRTLLFSDMTADSVKVTITIVSEGQAFIAVRTIYKVTDGAPGKDADPADVDLSPEHLAAILEGRITESQLFADLRSKIDLITDPVSVPGSVQSQIKAETDARVAAIDVEVQTRQTAIDKEVGDRIAAVLAEAGARTTYVQNYTFSQDQINSALSIQATQIAAGYTAYVDTKTGQVLSTAAADVRNYAYAKSDTDSAIAASETRLRSEFNSAGNVTMADVQNWSYSKAATDSAEAAQTATLTTSFQGYADQKKSEAITAAAADVRNYAYSKSAIDASEAAQSSTLTTNYTAYADAARTNAISTANADVRQYAYSKSTVDSAISSAIQELRSEFVGSGGATEAYVTNYAYSRSDIDQAEALQSSTLTTSYSNAINNIQIGGRNLYQKTSPFQFYTGASLTARLPTGFQLAGGGSSSPGLARLGNVITGNGQYTLSFDLQLGSANGFPLSIDICDGSVWIINPTTSVQHFSNTFTVNNWSTGTYNFIDFDQLSGQQYLFTNFKIENGNKATAYTPAPEDVDANIAAAIVSSAADVRQYAYSKSDVNGALASQSSQLTAAYTSYADAGKGQAIAASAADIRNYSYSKATVDSAIAQSTTQLTSTVGSHTTTLQQQSQSIGGLQAQYTVKIDNNGYVTGFGLASDATNGTPTSVFIVNSGAFSVVAPGGAPQPMFTVGQVNGQTLAVLRGQLIADSSILQSKLVVGGSPDNIVTDPQFRDLQWWGRSASATVGQWADAGQVTGWKGGASMYLAANAGETDTNTHAFQLTPGATYLIEIQVSISNDWNGRLGVYFLVQNVGWLNFISPVAGQNWGNGLAVQLNGNYPTKGISTFSVTYTVPPATTTTSNTMIKVMNSHTIGTVEIGSISMTRMSDTVLIKDGAVTANKITVNSLQAISNIVTARAGGSGAGIDQDQNGIRIYAPNGMRVVQLGNLDV